MLKGGGVTKRFWIFLTWALEVLAMLKGARKRGGGCKQFYSLLKEGRVAQKLEATPPHNY